MNQAELSAGNRKFTSQRVSLQVQGKAAAPAHISPLTRTTTEAALTNKGFRHQAVGMQLTTAGDTLIRSAHSDRPVHGAAGEDAPGPGITQHGSPQLSDTQPHIPLA